jgi:hypothetical protein
VYGGILPLGETFEAQDWHRGCHWLSLACDLWIRCRTDDQPQGEQFLDQHSSTYSLRTVSSFAAERQLIDLVVSEPFDQRRTVWSYRVSVAEGEEGLCQLGVAGADCAIWSSTCKI